MFSGIVNGCLHYVVLVHCLLCTIFLWQGLLVEDDPVSTPYTVMTCMEAQYLPTGSECKRWVSTLAESAPVTPPFVYNNQCTSVLLTAFIPVLIIGFTVQLTTTLILSLLSYRVDRITWIDLTGTVRHKMIPGIVWPRLWLNSDTSAFVRRNRAKLNDDPTILFSTRTILCFDVLNNAVIMLTFGFCSPVLALACTVVVVTKMKVLELLVGRFSAVLETDDTGCSVKGSGVHFAVVEMCRVSFPLVETLRESFWLLAGASAIFFSLLCWDMACDEVGWRDSLWVPLSAMSFPFILFMFDYLYRLHFFSVARCEDNSDEKGVEMSRTSTMSLSVASSNNYSVESNKNSSGSNPMHNEP